MMIDFWKKHARILATILSLQVVGATVAATAATGCAAEDETTADSGSAFGMTPPSTSGSGPARPVSDKPKEDPKKEAEEKAERERREKLEELRRKEREKPEDKKTLEEVQRGQAEILKQLLAEAEAAKTAGDFAKQAALVAQAEALEKELDARQKKLDQIRSKELYDANQRRIEEDRKLSVEDLQKKYGWTAEEAQRFKDGKAIGASDAQVQGALDAVKEALKGTPLEGAEGSLLGTGATGLSMNPKKTTPDGTGKPWDADGKGTSDLDLQLSPTQEQIDRLKRDGVTFNEDMGIFKNGGDNGLIAWLNKQKPGAGDALVKAIDDLKAATGRDADVKTRGTLPTNPWDKGYVPPATK